MKTATKESPKRHKALTSGRASAPGQRSRVHTKEGMMSNQCDSGQPAVLALELFHPNPNTLYSLDAAAHLAGVSRHSILVYCRVGLVHPVLQPPYGVMAFTGEAIQAVRRIHHVRAAYSVGSAWIKAMCCLLDEVERLRSEVRVLRDR